LRTLITQSRPRISRTFAEPPRAGSDLFARLNHVSRVRSRPSFSRSHHINKWHRRVAVELRFGSNAPVLRCRPSKMGSTANVEFAKNLSDIDVYV
jgi:hypothetical protein